MNFLTTPLLAIGFQELVGLVIVLISFISWLIRTVQGNAQQLPPPVQRPGRRREERVTDDFEAFLKNVNRGTDRNTTEPPMRAAEPNRSQGKKGGGNSGNRQAANASQQRAPQQRPQQKREPLSAPLNQSREFGSELKQHVREHMSERVQKGAEQDIGRGITESVQQHFGSVARSGASAPGATTSAFETGSLTSSTGECCTPMAQHLRSILREPGTIRRAIIVQEVLNRPKVLRKRSDT